MTQPATHTLDQLQQRHDRLERWAWRCRYASLLVFAALLLSMAAWVAYPPVGPLLVFAGCPALAAVLIVGITVLYRRLGRVTDELRTANRSAPGGDA